MDAGLPQGREVIETLLMRMWSNMLRQRQQQQQQQQQQDGAEGAAA